MTPNSKDSFLNLAKQRFRKFPKEIWFRSILLVLSFWLLVLIFSPNPVRLKEELKIGKASAQFQPTATSADKAASERIEKLIDVQHDKANAEIKMLQEQIDTWFHYKFLLIGGIIALFLGHFGLLGGKESTTPPKISEKVLITTLLSNRTSILLALVCIVAFVIDMHIRAHLTNMQGLGHWIYNYVEPSYFKEMGAETTNIPPEALVKTQFFPWETFLHTTTREVQQTNPLYRAAYSFQLHFLTIVMYMLYVVVFQNVCLRCKSVRQQQVAFIGFVVVHIAVLAFIIVGHTIPNSFDVRCFPLLPTDCWLTGSQGSTYYLLAWLSLIIVSLPYLYLLFPGFKKLTENTNPTS